MWSFNKKKIYPDNETEMSLVAQLREKQHELDELLSINKKSLIISLLMNEEYKDRSNIQLMGRFDTSVEAVGQAIYQLLYVVHDEYRDQSFDAVARIYQISVKKERLSNEIERIKSELGIR